MLIASAMLTPLIALMLPLMPDAVRAARCSFQR